MSGALVGAILGAAAADGSPTGSDADGSSSWPRSSSSSGRSLEAVEEDLRRSAVGGNEVDTTDAAPDRSD